jgi:enoyl-CoA hydratase
MTELTYETLLVDRPGEGVLQITLNRPEHGNAVVPELATELLEVLEAAEADQRIRVIVLTGSGKQFCAGADLKAMQRYLEHELNVLEEPYNARVLFPVALKLRSCRHAVIAAINGAATAGGLDLALACDIRLASDRARLGETYIRLGLAPGTGGSWFLPRLVGSGVAAELAFTGDLVDAQRAAELGLVNRVVPHDRLLDDALELASRIARWPTRAVEATKATLRTTWDTDLATALSASYWTTAALQRTRDFAEGVDAALERRDPNYNQPLPGSE